MNWQDQITTLGLLGAFVILAITIFVVSIYIKKIRDGRLEGQALEENWDGINEHNNDLPIGWAACFIGVLIWAFWYIFLGYPLNAYSQIGEYNEEVQNYNQKYANTWQGLDDKEKVEMGKGIFLVQCSQCHGITAEGMGGKARDLTKWAKEEGIIDVIKNGSKGLGYLSEMPYFKNEVGDISQMTPLDYLDESDMKATAAYIMQEISAVKNTKFPLEVAKGKAAYEENCASCHGIDGKGNGLEGDTEGMAADLTKYGTIDFLDNVLDKGKKGHIGIMPSFGYVNFAQSQKEALNAFIRSLQAEEE